MKNKECANLYFGFQWKTVLFLINLPDLTRLNTPFSLEYGVLKSRMLNFRCHQGLQTAEKKIRHLIVSSDPPSNPGIPKPA